MNESPTDPHDAEPTNAMSAEPELQNGTICRYERAEGFGYVEDMSRQHRYIFVVGTAIRHTDARQMQVGESVRFRVEGQGRVTELRRL